jgi:hypothetical protein
VNLLVHYISAKRFRGIDIELIENIDQYQMNLRFYSVNGGMMSQSLTAIISKSVTQKLLSVNQTMVITTCFLNFI